MILKKQRWQFNQWRSRFDRRYIKLDPQFCADSGLKFNELDCSRIKEAWEKGEMFFFRVDVGTYHIPERHILPESRETAKRLIEQRPPFWW